MEKADWVLAGASVATLGLVAFGAKLPRCCRREVRERDPRYVALLSPDMHALYHWLFRFNPEPIGLSRENNNRAIKATLGRLRLDMTIREFEVEYSNLLQSAITEHCKHSHD